MALLLKFFSTLNSILNQLLFRNILILKKSFDGFNNINTHPRPIEHLHSNHNTKSSPGTGSAVSSLSVTSHSSDSKLHIPVLMLCPTLMRGEHMLSKQSIPVVLRILPPVSVLPRRRIKKTATALD